MWPWSWRSFLAVAARGANAVEVGRDAVEGVMRGGAGRAAHGRGRAGAG